MPKNIDDIIVPEKRRSIRDIPIPQRKGAHTKKSEAIFPQRNQLDIPQEEFKPVRKNRRGLWVASVLSLLVIVFALLSFFNGATFSYIPKSTSFSFENKIYAAQKTGNGELPYSVVKLSGEEGLAVLASGKMEVSRKATGEIVVYNATNNSQRLRATTRFETPDGKIYQVEDAITVPAQRVVDGESQPGSLEITVYAEHPGIEYNIGLSDFTLPGLSGSSLFSSVYARSKTEMSGGFVGEEAVVSDTDKSRVMSDIETALKGAFVAEARAQVPEEFVLIPALSIATFEVLPQTDSTVENSTTINMRGSFQAVMFKKSDLFAHLALDQATLNAGESVDIRDIESLNFSFASTTSGDLLSLDEINFLVSGEVTAVWHIDEVSLKTDLIGKHKREISSVLNNYPAIVSATSTIRPFWRSSFPEDGARISIKQLPVK
jgi:hypothetical protein